MRVWQRWVFVAGLVGVVGIFVAVNCTRRAIHDEVTITFVCYTNLPDTIGRSAVFLIQLESPAEHFVYVTLVDSKRLEDDSQLQCLCPTHAPKIEFNGEQVSEYEALDEPSVRCRWRAKCAIVEPELTRKWVVRAVHAHLVPTNWLQSLPFSKILNNTTKIVYYYSPWLTNSPSPQPQP